MKIKKPIVFLSLLVLILICGSTTDANAVDYIQLIVNDRDLTALASPMIVNGRTLVPIRFVSEEIGATVMWDGEKRTVLVQKEGKSVFLRIDKHLIDYNHGALFQLSDVAPLIINDRTYVPLRLISNALGIGIDWAGATKTVFVDSRQSSQIQSFFDIQLTSPIEGDTIYGESQVTVSIPDSYKAITKVLKLMLLDKTTGTGFIIAMTEDLEAALNYLPRFEDNGPKILVAALYDQNNKFIGGDSIGVTLAVNPRVTLSGITDYGTITSTAVFKPSLNFLVESVQYELTKLENGKVSTITEQDPFGSYSWSPTMEQNGSYTIKCIASDSNGNAYESQTYHVTVAVTRKLSLTGVSGGMTINKPVTLNVSRNFDVTETRYILRDRATGRETILATKPYGSYSWFPDMAYAGNKELYVSVTDTKGQIHNSNPISVKVDGSPKVILKGIGPNQVLTGAADLAVTSNVQLASIKYILTNKTTGSTRILSSSSTPNQAYEFVPKSTDAGKVLIKAEGVFESKKIYTEEISLTIYLGKTYGPQAIIAKDRFLAFAADMAQESWAKTGMSAALQTAQSILETGWGQSVPVDKYSGKFSNNLFGIKGSSSNGSVISNTWEVYNGVTYRIDAAFRAYNDVQESWDDHKRLLLNASRYEPFREVMVDYSLGAWAIKRAGYATDPLYPMKLIRIIKQYNLQELDRVAP